MHVFKRGVDVSLVVYLHLHLIRDTLNSHNALSQRHQVSEKARCNVKRKLPLVGIYSNRSDVEEEKSRKVSVKRGGGWGEKYNFLHRQPVNRLMGGWQ